MTNITRTRGDTYPIELTLGADVTGGAFLLTVDPSPRPANADNNLFQVPGTITDAGGGVVEFDVSTENADSLGRYFYDVQMTLSGVVYTVAAGSITFVQDITK